MHRVRASLSDVVPTDRIPNHAMLAAGIASRDLAERLVVRGRAVGRHPDNIAGKSDVHERSKARRYARDHRLVSSDAGLR